jgi:hypothetical protein
VEGDATTARPEGSDPSFEDLVAQGYTKRQAAHIRRDPAKHARFLPRLSRKERGSYADPAAAEQFGQEVELYPQVPHDRPIYNLRQAIPEIAQPRSVLFEQLRAAAAADPGKTLRQVAEEAGIQLPAEEPPAPPAPGMERIIEWTSRLVLSPAVAGEAHPVNRKAAARVHLRALQRQTGLSDAALAHIAEVAGPRYDVRTGVLRLTCERYPARGDNRRHIVRTLSELVREGRRAFPSEEQQRSLSGE